MQTWASIAGYVAAACVGLTIFPSAMASLGLSGFEFYTRCLVAFMVGFVSSVFGIVAGIYYRLMGRPADGQWATGRCCRLLMKAAANVEFVVDDPHDYLSKTQPAVFLGNHQSEMDIVMLGSVFPKNCSVTAKKSIRNIPFIGWFMMLTGCIFIDRANSKTAREVMAGAASEMKRTNRSVFIFPEGTRSYSREPVLLPFKKGAFHLAIQGGVPIVPVVVANYSHVLFAKQRVFHSGKIPCKVLAPISTTGLTAADADELARTTRELMLKELLVLTAQATGGQVLEAPFAARDVVTKATGVQVRNEI